MLQVYNHHFIICILVTIIIYHYNHYHHDTYYHHCNYAIVEIIAIYLSIQTYISKLSRKPASASGSPLLL